MFGSSAGVLGRLNCGVERIGVEGIGHTQKLCKHVNLHMLCLLRLSLLRDSGCKIGTFGRIVGLDHFDLVKVSALLDAQVCSGT